ncbi:MAG: hypothetical protein ABIM89_07120 [Mycobacteriales bacterium]
MTGNSAPELLLDRRLIRGAVWCLPLCGVPAVAIAASTSGLAGAVGAIWGVACVALNGAAAAWVSASGGSTPRGIAIGRVLIALPLRLVLLGAAIAVGVLLLDLPSYPVVLSVCGAELFLMIAQSWLVLRTPTFVGPLS